MIQRILALHRYLFQSLAFSLSGVLYVILALATYFITFQQRTPEIEYFILVIGVFGGAVAFLITLSAAARANQAASYPLIARLPSRVEYLAGLLITAVLFATLLQLLVAGLALFRNGPDLTAVRAVQIPPIWLTFNLLAVVLALHASDFVASGWSRVIVYGLLAVLLFSQGGGGTLSDWLAGNVRQFSNWALRQQLAGLGQALNTLAAWLSGAGSGAIGDALGIVFWPFRAVAEATIDGRFSRAEAFAPALLLLYATILFLLAADVFAAKDLFLTED